MTNLPIEPALPELQEALRSRGCAVLVAPPGAGKTTRVPLALLDELWLEGRRIVMLEPRRLAAKTAARRMASTLGEDVGETVGYRVRMDTRVGPRTRIEVVTEGVLTRMLQEDQALVNVGVVIFDEYHERSLQADLGLALILQSRAVLRDDLRVLVMSATLAAEPVAALLGNAPVVVSEGRAFPVETRYAERAIPAVAGGVEAAVVQTVLEALERDEGDILAFLPGGGEIRRVEERLAAALGGYGASREGGGARSDVHGKAKAGVRGQERVRIAPLHGNLPQAQQDAAIAPGMPGERKVVLTTSIAETSLTVEGVRVVIDSGLSRVPRFSPRTGMSRLETVQVSRASADQRRGRAGRLTLGVCYRLWPEQDDRGLAPRSTPEILEADLAPLALELAAWGVIEPGELQWLDAPPAGAYQQARELLGRLGALSAAGAITPHGRRMAALGLHPRLAHMALRAAPLGYGALACELAALLSERDIMQGAGGALPDSDLRRRVEALRAVGRSRDAAPADAAGFAVDRAACRRLLAEAARWRRAIGAEPSAGGDVDACGLLLAFAYPDRIGQRRTPGRFLLSGGRGAAFATPQLLSSAAYLVAADLDDQGAESRIGLAAPVELSDLEQHFADLIATEEVVAWDQDAQSVRARKRIRLGSLLLQEVPLASPVPEHVVTALISGIREDGLSNILPWSRTAAQFRQRLHFMHRWDAGEWPDVSDDGLTESLENWLAPHLYGMKSRNDLQRLNMMHIFDAMLTWNRRQTLDEQAPTHITVPSGSRIPIDYSDPDAPMLAVRLQEMFGSHDTPRIGGGKVPLTLHLLSPAQRPVQVTRDLASFWQGAYFEVRKDLKGRYPKHYWPDDPHEATATNRTRPRV